MWLMLRNCPLVVLWPTNHFFPPEIGSYVVFPSSARGEGDLLLQYGLVTAERYDTEYPAV